MFPARRRWDREEFQSLFAVPPCQLCVILESQKSKCSVEEKLIGGVGRLHIGRCGEVVIRAGVILYIAVVAWGQFYKEPLCHAC